MTTDQLRDILNEVLALLAANRAFFTPPVIKFCNDALATLDGVDLPVLNLVREAVNAENKLSAGLNETLTQGITKLLNHPAELAIIARRL